MFGILIAVMCMMSDPLSAKEPTLISCKKIWDAAPHSAFTDLLEYQGVWYVVFRESDSHAGGSDGKIRLLASSDGEEWSSVKGFEEEGVDLRDPKLSITPKNELMLLIGGTIIDWDKRHVTRQSQVAFSKDGTEWTEFTDLLPTNEWVWRVTWHDGIAYGVSYKVEQHQWTVTVYSSRDGIHYKKIKEFDIEGKPSETTLRFLDNGDMVALMRRGNYPLGATLIGISSPPYKKWSWQNTKTSFGGPDFVILPDQKMWASGRIFKFDDEDNLVERTILAKMDLQSLTTVLELPCGGEDTSYPGIEYKDGVLWISYYSSHEGGKASIYLAKVAVKPQMSADR